MSTRQLPWFIVSSGGWRTEAIEFPPQGPPEFEAVWDRAAQLYVPDPESWGLSDITWGPSATDAIERYHQSETCPFGEIKLVKQTGGAIIPEWLEFVGAAGPVLKIAKDGVILPHSAFDFKYMPAFHALFGEAIAYIQAERSGKLNSRIHQSLEAA